MRNVKCLQVLMMAVFVSLLSACGGGGGGDASAGAPAPQAVPTALLGPTSYTSYANSPFNGQVLSYFHLEDFEDHLLNTPGVTASAGQVTSIIFPGYIDSVDADDGVIDGSGSSGDSYFYSPGSAGIDFSFDAAILGALPSHVGIVWTDGNGTTSFEAFDAANISLGVVGPIAIADGGNLGATAEDRFFGATHAGGISRIVIRNSSGGIEVDHLQYGR